MRVDGTSSIDQRVYDLLKQDLNATAVRGKVIANNISNVNTKEYKRFDVVFEEALSDDDKGIDLKKTNSKHLNGGDFEDGIKVQQDNSSSMRSDGNNVDIDMEKTNQAANTLLYNTLITNYNNRLNSERYVITGGGR